MQDIFKFKEADMCSTPRPSGKVRSARRAPVSRTFHSSYSQMMRTASMQYEQRQKERNKRQQLLLEKEVLEKEVPEEK